MSPSLNICPVTVVPIFAPITTGTALESFIMPAFIRPTTIIVVAEELCITPVTAVPKSTPLVLLLVSFSSIFSRLAPAIFSSAAPSTLIPKRKRPIPAKSGKIDIKLIFDCLL